MIPRAASRPLTSSPTNTEDDDDDNDDDDDDDDEIDTFNDGDGPLVLSTIVLSLLEFSSSACGSAVDNQSSLSSGKLLLIEVMRGSMKVSFVPLLTLGSVVGAVVWS